MRYFHIQFNRFFLGEQGATAVEYAVMFAAILLAVIGTVTAIGAQSGGMWDNNNSQLEAHGF